MIIKKGVTYKINGICGNIFLTINDDEIFIDIGKCGGCINAFSRTLGKIISIALQAGVPLRKIAEELINVSCSRDCGGGRRSCIDLIGRILKEHQKDIL